MTAEEKILKPLEELNTILLRQSKIYPNSIKNKSQSLKNKVSELNKDRVALLKNAETDELNHLESRVMQYQSFYVKVSSEIKKFNEEIDTIFIRIEQIKRENTIKPADKNSNEDAQLEQNLDNSYYLTEAEKNKAEQKYISKLNFIENIDYYENGSQLPFFKKLHEESIKNEEAAITTEQIK